MLRPRHDPAPILDAAPTLTADQGYRPRSISLSKPHTTARAALSSRSISSSPKLRVPAAPRTRRSGRRGRSPGGGGRNGTKGGSVNEAPGLS
jgi:hypothetical protein